MGIHTFRVTIRCRIPATTAHLDTPHRAPVRVGVVSHAIRVVALVRHAAHPRVVRCVECCQFICVLSLVESRVTRLCHFCILCRLGKVLHCEVCTSFQTV